MEYPPLFLDILERYYPNGPLKESLLRHSCQVWEKAEMIRKEQKLALTEEETALGALLHDIAIFRCHAPDIHCCGEEHYLRHGILGGELLREYGREKGLDLEKYAGVCEHHTGSGLTRENILAQNLPLPPEDLLPATLLEELICYADKFFSKSGDGQEKPLEKVKKSLARHGEDTLARFEKLHQKFRT